MYLAYRLSIASKNVQFERYAMDGANYVKDEEGSFVMGMLAIVFGPGTTVSDITTAAVHIANNGGESEVDFNLPSNVLAAALSEAACRSRTPQLFASISFNKRTTRSRSWRRTTPFSVLLHGRCTCPAALQEAAFSSALRRTEVQCLNTPIPRISTAVSMATSTRKETL